MLVLASRSPRRAELLRAAGFEFTVRAADVDEAYREGEDPAQYVQRVAEEKALAIHSPDGEIVLGADTVVVCGGEVMGKPKDHADAHRMLALLSGRKHEVLTGVCMRRAINVIREVASTSVWFALLTDDEIRDYVTSGEPMDKAGGYGIQGFASRFIDRIDGSYTNVVGLPVALVYRKMRELAG